MGHNLLNEIPFIIGGDFNIATNKNDITNYKKWKNNILFSKSEKHTFNNIINDNICDLIRMKNKKKELKGKKIFSWWNYKDKSWNKNKGLRIDYILSNKSASSYVKQTYINLIPC